MDYIIKILDEKKFKTWRGFRILEIKKEDDWTVSGFFDTLDYKDYPAFFLDVSKRGGAYLRELSFYYGPMDDGESMILKDDEVSVRFRDDIVKITIVEFEEIALSLAHKALEAVTWHNLKESGLVDDRWINAIKDWIFEKEKF